MNSSLKSIEETEDEDQKSQQLESTISKRIR